MLSVILDSEGGLLTLREQHDFLIEWPRFKSLARLAEWPHATFNKRRQVA